MLTLKIRRQEFISAQFYTLSACSTKRHDLAYKAYPRADISKTIFSWILIERQREKHSIQTDGICIDVSEYENKSRSTYCMFTFHRPRLAYRNQEAAQIATWAEEFQQTQQCQWSGSIGQYGADCLDPMLRRFEGTSQWRLGTSRSCQRLTALTRLE